MFKEYEIVTDYGRPVCAGKLSIAVKQEPLSRVGVVVVDVLNCRGARGSIRYVKQLKDPLAALHTAAASLFSLNNEGLMALIN